MTNPPATKTPIKPTVRTGKKGGLDEASIDTFVTMRSLMIIGWLDARRELPAFEHFADLATQAERISTRYLAAR